MIFSLAPVTWNAEPSWMIRDLIFGCFCTNLPKKRLGFPGWAYSRLLQRASSRSTAWFHDLLTRRHRLWGVLEGDAQQPDSVKEDCCLPEVRRGQEGQDHAENFAGEGYGRISPGLFDV